MNLYRQRYIHMTSCLDEKNNLGWARSKKVYSYNKLNYEYSLLLYIFEMLLNRKKIIKL